MITPDRTIIRTTEEEVWTFEFPLDLRELGDIVWQVRKRVEALKGEGNVYDDSARIEADEEKLTIRFAGTSTEKQATP